MTRKFITDNAQFYITNVCNLTCSECLTFNNRIFKGHFAWDSVDSIYKQWGTRLEIGNIAILGGEPFTNPFLLEWVHGLKECWPDTKDFSICTNGTFLDQELIGKIWDADFWLDICVHDPAMYHDIEQKIQTIVNAKFQNVRIEHVDHNNEKGHCYYYNNKQIVKISTHYIFSSSAVKFVKNNVSTMHDSDIKRAHDACQFKYDCHYFVHGELYKCSLTAIAKEFVKQFPLDEKSQQLLLEYKSGSIEDTDEQLEVFFNSLNSPIKQCSLCAENLTMVPIWPLSKKKPVY